MRRIFLFMLGGLFSCLLSATIARAAGHNIADCEPRGFDFSYHCGERLMVSHGYETYPARWKKPGQTLEILQPVFGKPGAFESCELKVEMKESAYYKHNGLLNEEPAAVFKAWMEKRQYDPEHGKTEPQPAPAPAAGAPAATGAAEPQ